MLSSADMDDLYPLAVDISKQYTSKDDDGMQQDANAGSSQLKKAMLTTLLTAHDTAGLAQPLLATLSTLGCIHVSHISLTLFGAHVADLRLLDCCNYKSSCLTVMRIAIGCAG